MDEYTYIQKIILYACNYLCCRCKTRLPLLPSLSYSFKHSVALFTPVKGIKYRTHITNVVISCCIDSELLVRSVEQMIHMYFKQVTSQTKHCNSILYYYVVVSCNVTESVKQALTTYLRTKNLWLYNYLLETHS